MFEKNSKTKILVLTKQEKVPVNLKVLPCFSYSGSEMSAEIITCRSKGFQELQLDVRIPLHCGNRRGQGNITWRGRPEMSRTF
jgi:hypothetical protein